jgi:OTU domain-containing protein 3
MFCRYHDWEHFSSVRNLTGPHAGLPYVVEKPATTAQAKQVNRAKTPMTPLPPVSSQSQSSLDSSSLTDMDDDLERKLEMEDEHVSQEQMQDQATGEQLLVSPIAVPLPMSRTPSPPPSSETSASASASASSSQSATIPLLPGYNCPPDYARLRLRVNGSPKRAYDNAEEAAEDSQGEAKRSRRSSRVRSSATIKARLGGRYQEGGEDGDADTPDLLSSAEADSSENDSSSPATTPPPPSMVVVPPSPTSAKAHAMPKRERKKMGLPKARKGTRKGTTEVKVSAGKIRVPGGRFRKDGLAESGTTSKPVSKAGSVAGEAWVRNGSGRVDVRGFKELKI